MRTFAVIATLVLFTGTAFAEYVPPSQIVGQAGSTNGETDNQSVQCILRKDYANVDAVAGELIVEKSYLGLGVTLAVLDAKGKLLCSSSVEAREKDGRMHYYFLVNRDLVGFAKLVLFTKDKDMIELKLRTVNVLPRSKG